MEILNFSMDQILVKTDFQIALQFDYLKKSFKIPYHSNHLTEEFRAVLPSRLHSITFSGAIWRESVSTIIRNFYSRLLIKSY